MPADLRSRQPLPKAATGIAGFDEITQGGLPAGRPTLICGAAGSGKTLFAAMFLVNGAVRYDEAGVFMSFEERASDLSANVASLGYDLDGLVEAGKLAIDHVHVERSEIEETGEYDLEGLFVRLGFAVAAVGAKRIVLDTIETLFASFTNTAVLRSELRRLFGWIKDQGLTAIITGERGDGQLTRQGLEEYVSDCVILLDNRVHDQVSTRRLRVVKYRGSAHGTNEYPFLIDDDGFSVLPITAAGLRQGTSDEVISTGVAGLDAMVRPRGVYRGSSILLSGPAGTGKTSFAVSAIDAACARGERCLMCVYEESQEQIVRNARSIGIDLSRHIAAGLLTFEAARPSLYGLEMHLARLYQDIERDQPSLVVIDSISALRGPFPEVYATLLRMTDLLKSRGITGVFTALRLDDDTPSQTERGISSLMDVWITLDNVVENGERNRVLYMIKSRGMSHSHQVREYTLSDHGITLIEPYFGPEGVLTGTARMSQFAREEAAALARRQGAERAQRDLERRRALLERQIADTRANFANEEVEVLHAIAEEASREAALDADRAGMVTRRTAAE